MQIPIASSLYYTTVVIRRLEIWGPKFCSPFFQHRQCFHKNIINNHNNHKNYDPTMHQSFGTYFNSIGKKIHTLPRCGLVTMFKFHKNIINNHTNHKNYDATMHQSFSTYFSIFGKKYTPCGGVVWSQYSLPGAFYVPLGFGVVLFAKVCFLLPVQFWKAVDFTLALLYIPKL